MAHHDELAAHDKHHMGMPLPNGKLAMWLFLVTEIMFFTALIGTYLLLRNGQPRPHYDPWPKPEAVHLIEALGAINTFVLICSSFTVVLAHYYLHHGNAKKATQMVGLTLLFGCVFLGIKAYEYYSKFDHRILPGYVHEKLDGPAGYRYVRDVRGHLEHLLADPAHAGLRLSAEAHTAWDGLVKEADTILGEEKGKKGAEAKDTKPKEGEAKQEHAKEEHGLKIKALDEHPEAKAKVRKKLSALVAKHAEFKVVSAAWDLYDELPGLNPKVVNLRVAGSEHVHPVDLPKGRAPDDPVVKGLLNMDENQKGLHIPYSIPYGNLWASCYFAMTGFHALHVLGGLVIFTIILLMALVGNFGPQHVNLLENVGLYWHFVDIVWIFLFPLLYLI